jgi:hypothetical protein
MHLDRLACHAREGSLEPECAVHILYYRIVCRRLALGPISRSYSRRWAETLVSRANRRASLRLKRRQTDLHT